MTNVGSNLEKNFIQNEFLGAKAPLGLVSVSECVTKKLEISKFHKI